MTMDFFLDRKDQAALSEKLALVPSLVEDLAVTITRQSRMQRSNATKLKRRKPESQLPYHAGAAQAADELHNALVTWVRFVCESRMIRYTGSDDDITLSRWLQKNMIALALTEGSEEAWPDLAHYIEQCRRQVDLPPDDEVVIDRQRLREANRQILTSGQVEKIAHRLGDMGKGLSAERVHTLTRRGYLTPVNVDRDTGTKFYQLGDVLHAHIECVRRNRKKRSA